MRYVPRDLTTAATTFALAVLLPATTAAFVPGKPIPLEQLVMWSDAIVVGAPQDSEPPERGLANPRNTINVEQWIVPAHGKSKTLQINGSNSYRADLGRRVLLLLRWPKSPMPFAGYYAMQVIDLEDVRDVTKALEELDSPWIPYVTSTTSYPLTEWDDWSSHPIKVPMQDPRLLEIERILKAARSQIDGR